MKLDHSINSLILQKITGLSREQLFLKGENIKLTKLQKEKYNNYIGRLNSGEPIEYIIENANFYGINFFVDSRVLISRDDTEIMVEKAIETIITYPKASTDNDIELEQKITLIDVGTGSSCIPISILKNTNRINNCYVIDISKNALEVSKKNINKYKLDKKIKQIHGSLIKKIIGNNDYKLNKNIIITSNLPYIKYGDFKNIDKETIKYEPDLALYGGKKTGFELYEKLIHQCLELQNIYNIKKLVLFIEIGFDQKEIAKRFLKKLDLKFEIFKDNNFIDRCIKIFLNSN